MALQWWQTQINEALGPHRSRPPQRCHIDIVHYYLLPNGKEVSYPYTLIFYSPNINVAGLYYFAFFLVCVVHGLQWMHIHHRVKSAQFEKKKIVFLFIILSVSYLARGILNTVQTKLMNLQCHNWPYNYLWCLFLLIFYGMELFFPLQILFYFQFCKNTKSDTKSMIDSQITTYEEDCSSPLNHRSQNVYVDLSNNLSKVESR